MDLKRKSTALADDEIHYAIGSCSIGGVLVAQSAKGICAVLLSNNKKLLIADLLRRFPLASLINKKPPLFDRTVKALELRDGKTSVPLDLRGTAFQQKVWRALQKIPAGATTSYLEIAQSLGMPKSARAVGAACGANHISILVPCHRAVRTNGQLAGYHWGLPLKRKLLDREANSPIH